jgi:carboxylesterase type B
VERVRSLLKVMSRRCLVEVYSIRFAAPPTGTLRWQAPQPPTSNRTGVIPANAFAPFCPQNPDAPSGPEPAYGNEDCLFLNVYSPANASSLPVLVWIHGGGYGAGNGREDLSPIINANHNNFVGVAIQYRVRTPDFEDECWHLLMSR